MINTNVAQHAGLFDGFKNTNEVTFSASHGGGNLPAPGPSTSGFVGPIRAEVSLNNQNRVSQAQVQLEGLESFYRLVQGSITVNYPSLNDWRYQIQVFTYFKDGKLIADAYIINQYGDTVFVPAITFRYRASLFVPPF